jgi:hypothetical protein
MILVKVKVPKESVIAFLEILSAKSWAVAPGSGVSYTASNTLPENERFWLNTERAEIKIQPPNHPVLAFMMRRYDLNQNEIPIQDYI